MAIAAKITVMKKPAPACLLLQKIDASRNMARFYVMSVQPTLFGGGSLVRNWGRIGTRGRAMIELFENLAEADTAMSKHAKAKCRRGYICEERAIRQATDPNSKLPSSQGNR